MYDCLYVALAEREGCELVTADVRLINSLQPTLSVYHRAGSIPLSIAAPSTDIPLIRSFYRRVLKFASVTPSKRAYYLHWAFFDGSNPLAVQAYVNCPAPSVGAGFFTYAVRSYGDLRTSKEGAGHSQSCLNTEKTSVLCDSSLVHSLRYPCTHTAPPSGYGFSGRCSADAPSVPPPDGSVPLTDTASGKTPEGLRAKRKP